VSRAPRPAAMPCKLDGGQVAPVRTCIGCGERAAKSDLLRVVAAGDEIVPDVTFRLPGRGAYLHPSLACLERAERRKAFPRALRQAAALPASKVAEFLTVSTAGGTGRKKADLQ
jgi:predicted RNA-binding protein YlxR (DUF448 family)